MTTIHRMIYYLHFFQIKFFLNDLHLIQIIDFIRQHVARKDWSEIKHVFYDFRDQTGNFHVLNET